MADLICITIKLEKKDGKSTSFYNHWPIGLRFPERGEKIFCEGIIVQVDRVEWTIADTRSFRDKSPLIYLFLKEIDL